MKMQKEVLLHILFFVVVFSFHMVSFSNAQDINLLISPMEKVEQETLYSVIQEFVGEDWNGSYLYPDPCGWTPIQGVACDIFNDLWYVTDLSIGQVYDNSLNCTTTAQFANGVFKFKYLKKLTFSKCFLSTHQKPINLPDSGWEMLSNTLEYLEIRSNPGLIGTIPSKIGSLRNLESLVFIENGLAGELVDNIGQLSKLKRLVLAGNRFSGGIPASYGALNQLLIFDASRNSLSGELPGSIGGLSSLLKLDLSNNRLIGRIPIEMKNMKSLTLLDLSYNNFSGGLNRNSIQEMWALQEMMISNNPLGGTLIAIRWENLQNLEVLDLSNTEMTGNIPDSMTKMKNLRFLGLGNNMFTGSIPQMLEKLPYISGISINGNNFTGKLEFSEQFYKKLGNRFRVYDNLNLCFPSELVSLTHHVPLGVKSC